MFDFKSLKKTADDSKVATMEHPSGHKIQIVKSALSPALRKQLDKLPLHQANPQGEVVDPEADSDSSQVQAPQGTTININAGPSMPAQDPHNIMHPQVQPQISAPPPIPGQVEGGVAAPPSNILSQVGGGTPTTPPQPPPAPPAPDPEAAFKAVPGYNEQVAGAEAQSKAASDMGDTQAKLLSQSAKTEQTAEAALHQELSEKAMEVKKATADMLAHDIKPNHYLESMGTGGKIATAIGLLAGGISSGQTGQPNPAMAFLQSQIERDLKSQEVNLGNRHNLLTALENQYKDKIVAANMFRAIRANTLADQLGAAAATAQSAQAKAALLTARGAFKQQAIPLIQKASLLSMRNDVMGAGGGADFDSKVGRYLQAANAVDPKESEEFQKHLISGVGVSQVPLEPKDRELLQRKTQMDALLGRAQKYMQKVGTLGAWTPGLKSEGEAIQGALNLEQGQFADLARFTPEENKLYKKLTPDLSGTHFTGKDQALLTALKQRNDDVINTFYTQKGINRRVSAPEDVVKGIDPTTGKIRSYKRSGNSMVPVD